MASPSIRAKTTVVQATTNPLAFAKPTGLAVGDLLVLFVVSNNAAPASLPDGFAQIEYTGANTYRLTIATKTAVQADTEAASFGVGTNGTNRFGGVLYAVKDWGSVEHSDAAYTAASQYPVVSAGFTPAATGDLLLVSGYANRGIKRAYTANNNPTWTEEYNDDSYWLQNHRSGPYTTGATGNIGMVLSSSGASAAGVVAVAPASAPPAPTYIPGIMRHHIIGKGVMVHG